MSMSHSLSICPVCMFMLLHLHSTCILNAQNRRDALTEEPLPYACMLANMMDTRVTAIHTHMCTIYFPSRRRKPERLNFMLPMSSFAARRAHTQRALGHSSRARMSHRGGFGDCRRQNFYRSGGRYIQTHTQTHTLPDRPSDRRTETGRDECVLGIVAK